MELELAIIERSQDKVSVAGAASKARMAALILSSKVERVTNPDEQTIAVEAQQAVKTLLNQVEKSRKAIKEPVLTLGKKIDTIAKDFAKPLDEELVRLSTLSAEYLEHQRVLLQGQAQQYNEALTALEREREAKLAECKDLAESDAIREEYAQKIAELQAPPSFQKADGQRITEDWEIEVFDVHALYRSYPNCVKSTPLLTEIRMILDSGVQKIPGVRAKKILKSGVTIKKAHAELEI